MVLLWWCCVNFWEWRVSLETVKRDDRDLTSCIMSGFMVSKYAASIDKGDGLFC